MSVEEEWLDKMPTNTTLVFAKCIRPLDYISLYGAKQIEFEVGDVYIVDTNTYETKDKNGSVFLVKGSRDFRDHFVYRQYSISYITTEFIKIM